MIALVVGTLLALVALGYVLHPLFLDARDGALPPRALPPEVPEEDAIAALREIEFDRATGKLSDADYAALKTTYTERALATMRAGDASAALATMSTDDAAEAVVRRFRMQLTECPECGPRPEADAVYCSQCGRYLPGRCAHCGAAVTQRAARFCASCGHTLAA